MELAGEMSSSRSRFRRQDVTRIFPYIAEIIFAETAMLRTLQCAASETVSFARMLFGGL
jgi:hypothetical protein